MADFPTLTAHPVDENPYEPLDNAVKTPAANGKVLSRKRFTADIFQFQIKYHLRDSDVALLKAFWLTVGTYDTFNYTYKGITYVVRFKDVIKYTEVPGKYTVVTIILLSS